MKPQRAVAVEIQPARTAMEQPCAKIRRERWVTTDG